MSEYNKPLPEIQPYSRGYWDGTKQHKLLVEKEITPTLN
mgnify:CR=1 FL=1